MAQILDLRTIDPARPTIAVDGVGYELQLTDDFGLVELARLQRLQTTVGEIMARQADLSDADVQAMAGALDGFTALVLPSVPAEVRARLRDAQKMAILAAFRQAAEARGQPLPPAPAPPRKSRKTARTSRAVRT